MKINISHFAVLVLLGLSGFSSAEPKSLRALSGEMVTPLSCDAGERFALLVFTATDCPIANAYVPELNRLHKLVDERGGKFTLVQVDWELTDEKAKKHVREFGITASVVIDRKHELVRATGAKMTPEAVLLNSKGAVVYRGRISNLFTDYGDRRRVVSQHDLRNAVSSLLEEEPIAVASKPVIGCFIPDFPD